jgi:hypothetical protein
MYTIEDGKIRFIEEVKNIEEDFLYFVYHLKEDRKHFDIIVDSVISPKCFPENYVRYRLIDILKGNGKTKLTSEEKEIISEIFASKNVEVEYLSDKVIVDGKEYRLTTAVLEFIENPLEFLKNLDKETLESIYYKTLKNYDKIKDERFKVLYNLISFHLFKEPFFKNVGYFLFKDKKDGKIKYGIKDYIPFLILH